MFPPLARGRGRDEVAPGAPPDRAGPAVPPDPGRAGTALGRGDPGRGDYREVLDEVRAAGLLRRTPIYYAFTIASTVVAYAAGWAALFVLGDTWAALGVAAFLAVAFTQVVFIGHDAGHRQIFRTRRGNELLGLAVGDLMTGLSFGWWVPKHNAHHAHPNQVDRDPDIAVGVLAWTPEIARARRGLAGALARRQAWAFFPLLLVLAFAMHRSSARLVVGRRSRSATVEAVLLLVHAAAYLTVVFWLLSPLRAVAFVAVQQGLFGLYLGCAFAPNHKGMPIVENASDLSFVRRQVMTARNVSGGRLTTWMLGGLNFQIEHHLFPTMPRANLVRAQHIVQRFCADHEIAYHQETLIGSYRRALRHLRDVGAGVGRDGCTSAPDGQATLPAPGRKLLPAAASGVTSLRSN
ncbi:MAG: fatty acid desaturase family protein [Acidimicrobiales bacterium]